MKLAIDPPADFMVTDLAPRVEIISGEFKNEWGYALCLTSEQNVRILTDTEGIQDIHYSKVLFRSF